MPTDIEKCVVKGHLSEGQQQRNVFYGEVTWNGADTPMVIWDGYIRHIFEPIVGQFGPTWGIDGIDVYVWTPPNWVLIGSQALVLVGGNGDPAMPNTLAAVVIGKVPGHRGFGRKFLSGFRKNAISGNSIDPGLIALLVQFTIDWISVHTGIGMGQIVPGIFTKAKTFLAFASGVVDALIGSMRRRKPGIGI